MSTPISPDDSSQTKGKFLVVDDSATNRALLRALLERAGYEVDECENGQECLQYCEKQLPLMILLDIMMPVMDGITACQDLRRVHDCHELPIIMVTTKSQGSDLMQGLAAGANDYVTKPVDRDILFARIENQLTSAQALRELANSRRHLEHTLRVQRAMGDVLPEAVVVHSLDGRVLYANAQLGVFCGEERLDAADTVFNSIFEGKLASLLFGRLQRFKKNPYEELEVELSVPTVPRRHVVVLSKPVYLDDKPKLRMWVWRDVTEMRELERRINQQIKLETVGQFAAGVAHNFNNILGAIMGASQLLERVCAENERGKRCVSVITRSVESARKLTGKMGALMRKAARTSEQEYETLAMVCEELQAFERVRDNPSIELLIELDDDVRDVAIPVRNLSIIVENVVDNALDALRGEGRVVLSARRDPQGESLLVTVRDNGVGMDSVTLSRVFEPFFSTKNLDHRNGVSMEGNGLGLWNVYHLLKMAGGDIDITSKTEVGSEVRITFPLGTAVR